MRGKKSYGRPAVFLFYSGRTEGLSVMVDKMMMVCVLTTPGTFFIHVRSFSRAPVFSVTIFSE